MSFLHFSIPPKCHEEDKMPKVEGVCIVGIIGRSRSDPSTLCSLINCSLPGARFVQSKSESDIQVSAV